MMQSYQTLTRVINDIPISDFENYGKDDPEPKFRFVLEVKRIGKSIIWSTMDRVIHYYNGSLVNIIKTRTDKENLEEGFTISYTLKEDFELSELEKKMLYLFSKNIISEDYVQDFFVQEQMFKDNSENLLSDVKNKEILVCGGKIFSGNVFEEVLKQARSEFPDRPYYSYSTKMEPVIL